MDCSYLAAFRILQQCWESPWDQLHSSQPLINATVREENEATASAAPLESKKFVATDWLIKTLMQLTPCRHFYSLYMKQPLGMVGKTDNI